jgi:hypothetical protein
MPLLTVCYVKGRPGATATALGLAVVAPAEARAVLVECDPSGGDLAARHGRTFSPGVVELATATRSARHPADVLSRFTQRITIGHDAVDVVLAPAGALQTRAAVSVLAGPGRAALTGTDRFVVADCGRLDVTSPVWPLLAAADVVLVLVDGALGELAHLREHADELVRAAGGRLAVALGPGGGPYGRDDVTELLAGVEADGFRVVGQVPRDMAAAEALGGGTRAGHRWRRLPLAKALARFWTEMPVRRRPSSPPVHHVRAEVG